MCLLFRPSDQVDIDISLSAYANARKYYEMKKTTEQKKNKTIGAVEVSEGQFQVSPRLLNITFFLCRTHSKQQKRREETQSRMLKSNQESNK